MSNIPKILIVDDNPRMCDSLKALLSDQGYELKTSNSAKDAIECLENNAIDVVLLDLVMGDENGCKVMDHIISQKLDTLVVIITGHPSTDTAIEALRKGAYDYLKKPFEPEELLTTVKNALNQQIMKRDSNVLKKGLKETEERYQALFDRSLDCVYIHDFKGNFIDVNPATLDLLGYTKEDISSLNFASILTEDQIPIAFQATEEIKRTGSQKDLTEFKLRRKDGEYVFVETKGSLLYRNGKPYANQGIARNITERKRAEEALRTSQEYTRNVIESSMDMIITSNKDRNIVEFNKAAEKTFGYGREEVIGKPADILYADPQEGIAVHKTTAEQGHCVQETLNRRKNGKVFPSFLSASLLRDAHGEAMGVVRVSRDITRSKQTEEQIKTSLKEKEVLLGEIHHRVKNNLQIISSLLDMRIMRTDNKQIINFFEDIRSKIYTMALIHTQLYRSERFDQINMGAHVQELVNYLSSIYTREGISITPMIEASDVHLSATQAIPCALVLNELLSNAFKHAFKEGQKGTIEISLKKTDHNKVLLQVKDNGIGIPDEIDIFKTDSLGFKLMRNTVQDQLTGKIHIERGVGTTIIVEFKILEEEVNHG